LRLFCSYFYPCEIEYKDSEFWNADDADNADSAIRQLQLAKKNPLICHFFQTYTTNKRENDASDKIIAIFACEKEHNL